MENNGALQCSNVTCAVEAVCTIEEGVRDCYCLEGYAGNGRECEGECVDVVGGEGEGG